MGDGMDRANAETGKESGGKRVDDYIARVDTASDDAWKFDVNSGVTNDRKAITYYFIPIEFTYYDVFSGGNYFYSDFWIYQ